MRTLEHKRSARTAPIATGSEMRDNAK